MNYNLLPLALGDLATGTTESVIIGLLPIISQALHVTIPEAGYVSSAYALLGVVIGAPLLTVLRRSLGPKRRLFLLMLFTVFNMLSAFTPNNTTLFLRGCWRGCRTVPSLGWG